MAIETTLWDSSKYLDSDEAIVAYMDDILEAGDPALVTHALGQIAKARGMTQIARETGLSRESLYRALSAEGHPEFATVMKVMRALGLRLSASATKAA